MYLSPLYIIGGVADLIIDKSLSIYLIFFGLEAIYNNIYIVLLPIYIEFIKVHRFHIQ